MNPTNPRNATVACLFASAAILLCGQQARAAWPQSETHYADPFLVPEQRQNNMVEFQMTPVVSGDDVGDLFGLHLHFHVLQAAVLSLGMGRRTSEWQSAYTAGGDFLKTYTFQFRAGWGSAAQASAHSIVMGLGLDLSDDTAFSVRPGYSIEFRPATGFSVELFFKSSYEVFKGGHAVVEFRVPAILYQPDLNTGNGGGGDLLGDMLNVDMAIGWRQNWGPLTGGLGFIFHVLGSDNSNGSRSVDPYWRGREKVALMLDLGLVFY